MFTLKMWTITLCSNGKCKLMLLFFMCVLPAFWSWLSQELKLLWKCSKRIGQKYINAAPRKQVTFITHLLVFSKADLNKMKILKILKQIKKLFLSFHVAFCSFQVGLFSIRIILLSRTVGNLKINNAFLLIYKITKEI